MRNCKICNTEFKPSSVRFKTCSQQCRDKNNRVNHSNKRYSKSSTETENPTVRFNNQFLLRGQAI